MQDDSVLLVENVRRNGSVDWSTPGGVVDAGESSIEGLTREVQEETGLSVTKWTGPIYEVEVTAPDAGFRLHVQAFLAVEYGGEIVIDDPDGIVISAIYVAVDKVGQQMADGPQWVAEPLISHLTSGIEPGHRFEYVVTGTKHDQVVERLN